MRRDPARATPALVILAAGSSTRFGDLKQLAPVGPGGETLLEYSAFDAVRAGFGRVVLVVHPETERLFRRRLDRRMARRLPLAYAHQRLDQPPTGSGPPPARRRPWGTAHAVLAADGQIDGPFAVVNADDFYGASSFSVLAAFFDRCVAPARLTTVGFRLAETLTDSGPVSRAILEVDDGGRLRQAIELPAVWRRDGRILGRDDAGRERTLTGEELVSMNMWGLRPNLLAALRGCFAGFLAHSGRAAEDELRLPDVVQSLVAAGRFQVEVLAGGGEWCGLTFHRDQPLVRAKIASLIAAGCYPADLWA